MDLNIIGRNVEITDALRSYIDKKIGKLDRYLPSIVDGQVELTKQTTKSSKDRNRVQVTLRANGSILRAEDKNADIFTAIDAVLDKTYRQIARYKGKREESRIRAQGQGEALPVADAEEATDAVVARRKRFLVRPMTEQEAIEQMELLGHDFFIFYSPDSESMNVLYRRKEGNYGILEPILR